MRASTGTLVLRLLGVLCALAGIAAWIALGWKAITDVDSVTPQSEEGGSLTAWALAGTLLMIVGTVFLHVAANAPEQEGGGTPTS